MNWCPKVAVLLLLGVWLWPPSIGVAGAVLYVSEAPWYAYVVLLAPTILLVVAIMDSILLRRDVLPGWAWPFNTPDSPTSPYSDYEPAAKSYYVLGRFIGDYLWLAWRNSWYGLAFHWGLWPTQDWLWHAKGNPYTADTDPRTGQFVYGKLYVWAQDKTGAVVGWCRRGTIMLGGSHFLKYWFGWKCAEYVQPDAKPEPPSMMALQIEIRSVPRGA